MSYGPDRRTSPPPDRRTMPCRWPARFPHEAFVVIIIVAASHDRLRSLGRGQSIMFARAFAVVPQRQSEVDRPCALCCSLVTSEEVSRHEYRFHTTCGARHDDKCGRASDRIQLRMLNQIRDPLQTACLVHARQRPGYAPTVNIRIRF